MYHIFWFDHTMLGFNFFLICRTHFPFCNLQRPWVWTPFSLQSGKQEPVQTFASSFNRSCVSFLPYNAWYFPLTLEWITCSEGNSLHSLSCARVNTCSFPGCGSGVLSLVPPVVCCALTRIVHSEDMATYASFIPSADGVLLSVSMKRWGVSIWQPGSLPWSLCCTRTGSWSI